ncbi:MAG: hypothetical protein J6N52_06650, partial [Clostridia bacterium]|nr:hypothetical protein [Clostridia bacterium]
MENKSQIRSNIAGLSFLAFALAVVFIVGHTREIINIITSFVKYEQRSYLNISNIAYCLVGVAHLFFSITLMYPHRVINDKRKMLKYTCYALAAIYFSANIWVVEWLLSCIASRHMTFDVAQFLKVENMMFNHLQWASRNAETIFYNYISFATWLAIGYYVDRDRRFTCKLFVLQIAISYFIPMLFYYLYRGKSIPDWWMKKTIPILCSDAIIAFTLFYASRSRETWKRYISPLKSRGGHHHHHHHH